MSADMQPATDDLVRRRFIGRALLHVHTFNREALDDLFAQLPPPIRVRAARAVSDRLLAHARGHDCWAWCVWAAHALPTVYNLTLAIEFARRLNRTGG